MVSAGVEINVSQQKLDEWCVVESCSENFNLLNSGAYRSRRIRRAASEPCKCSLDKVSDLFYWHRCTSGPMIRLQRSSTLMLVQASPLTCSELPYHLKQLNCYKLHVARHHITCSKASPGRSPARNAVDVVGTDAIYQVLSLAPVFSLLQSNERAKSAPIPTTLSENLRRNTGSSGLVPSISKQSQNGAPTRCSIWWEKFRNLCCKSTSEWHLLQPTLMTIRF